MFLCLGYCFCRLASFLGRNFSFQDTILFRNHPFQELSFSGNNLFRTYLFQEIFLAENILLFRIFIQAARQEEMIAIEMTDLNHNIYCVIVVCNCS